MERVVVARDVTKRFGTTTAVRSVSLSIEAGEIFTLIGPNGAGKTTTVRLVTGTTRPTDGVVELFGTTPSRVPRERLGVLPQSFHPPDRLTGRELITYYAGLYDGARPVADVLDDVGMADDADRWYERLSGGQQRRLCVGSALVNDPDLLILDEPTTGIDPGGRRRLWRLLDRLRDEGTTILLTTHDMQEAQAVSDRVGLIHDGRLVRAGSPDELIAAYAGTGRLIVDLHEPEPSTLDAVLRPHETSIHNGELRIKDVEPEQIGAIVADLGEAGIAYEKLAWERPGLDDVFLAVTEAAERSEGR